MVTSKGAEGLKESKRAEKPQAPSKWPKLTEKEQGELKLLRSGFVWALKKSGFYNPTLDEPLVEEACRVILLCRRVDEWLDRAADPKTTSALIDMRVKINSTLRGCLEALAATRRLRIEMGEESDEEDEVTRRLKELMMGRPSSSSPSKPPTDRSSEPHHPIGLKVLLPPSLEEGLNGLVV